LPNREIVTGSAGHSSHKSRKRGREIKKKAKKYSESLETQRGQTEKEGKKRTWGFWMVRHVLSRYAFKCDFLGIR
jgi:hypothetical protein